MVEEESKNACNGVRLEDLTMSIEKSDDKGNLVRKTKCIAEAHFFFRTIFPPVFHSRRRLA